MKKYNILIVEDETNILRIISNYFKKANYEVYEASDGEEALNVFYNTNLDIIILDIMLPKIDGFEVARRIRSSSNIPLIAMTALGQEQDMIKGERRNAELETGTCYRKHFDFSVWMQRSDK